MAPGCRLYLVVDECVSTVRVWVGNSDSEIFIALDSDGFEERAFRVEVMREKRLLTKDKDKNQPYVTRSKKKPMPTGNVIDIWIQEDQ